MTTALPCWPRLRTALLAVACLAMLIGRTAAPILPMPAMAQAMLIAAGICHAPDSNSPDSDKTPGQHEHCQDCTASPFAALAATDTAPLPTPVAWIATRFIGPAEATGPPAAPHRPFAARAPPALSA